MNVDRRGITLAGADEPPATPREAFLESTAERVDSIVTALAPSGSSVLLVGDAGSGKSMLAQEAAREFERVSATRHARIVLPSFAALRPAVDYSAPLRPEQEAELILDGLTRQAKGTDIFIVALDVDRYSPDESALLELLVRARRVRLVCTAERVVGAADRIIRNPDVREVAVTPLTFEESGEYLARILGVDSVSPDSVARWHTATAGNQHALAILAVDAERRGVVHRTRRMAWVLPHDDIPPQDFIDQLGDLTPQEFAVLELVSVAAPLHERALLALLDSHSVNRLLAKRVITVRVETNGHTSLATRLPILATAIRAHLSPLRRSALAQACYDALTSPTSGAHVEYGNKLRLVRFGLEAGRDVPIDWTWQAMHSSARSGDFSLTLRLALGAMSHEHPQRSAEAILTACDLSHFLGDRDCLDEALLALDELLNAPDRFATVEFDLQAILVFVSITLHARYRGRTDDALAALARWNTRWAEAGIDATRIIQACTVRTLAFAGRLKSALNACEPIGRVHDLETEWQSVPTRSLEALLRVQRGEFAVGIELAHTARQLVLLHDFSPTLSGDLEWFTIFLAHWARGTKQMAALTLDGIASARQDLRASHTHSGLIYLAASLYAVQDGRWVEARELVVSLHESLTRRDPFIITPFTHALSALISAALGETAEAERSLALATPTQSGLSQTLKGFGEMLALRARHWLRDPSLLRRARTVAEWAASEGLHLIELEALGIVAHETHDADPALLDRAALLADCVDRPIGEAILAHIRALTHTPTEREVEERLLSELGVWLPLPQVSHLTAREREVALYTSLGYSAKHIAEQLHLSVRTVETHLGNLYSKLDITNRDDLRAWFASSRAQSA